MCTQHHTLLNNSRPKADNSNECNKKIQVHVWMQRHYERALELLRALVELRRRHRYTPPRLNVIAIYSFIHIVHVRCLFN